MAVPPVGQAANFNNELAALPISHVLGTPVNAAIDAQWTASQNMIEFLKKAGFQGGGKGGKKKGGGKGGKDSWGKPIQISFELERPGALFGMPTKTVLKVPLLTMLPIPFIRLEYLMVDFNVKLTSNESASFDGSNYDISTSNVKTNSKAGSFGWGRNSIYSSRSNTKTEATAAYVDISKSKEGVEITRDYSLAIKMKFVQDEIPEGLEKILNILDGQIREQAKEAKEGEKGGEPKAPEVP
mmetsp:Transcript_36496/g.91480  ORF Transcript_36496/g.91480 Transcript_36496/m.91480 type:complete len:241 (+) Transcript_36496:190-912(+)|eukprot:CAMPEP_0177663380 /NCGR_PEP_ID=MMETSP0447-20121125/19880_1 /TAXON_ID=0 /ORGANISM="Stygamoeba regulata, Strain BSH-02190019" /LENGTH=240 /DNA_ID=CAMNT_0019169183 /DNA_START=190 /DNA_END=912 /DNA_ORIENTATION=+